MTDESKVYYCNHCKSFIDELEDLLFVEEGNSKGFCSENCIEKFYQHLVEFFEERDKEYREDKRDYFARGRPDREETPQRGRTIVKGQLGKSEGVRFFNIKKGPLPSNPPPPKPKTQKRARTLVAPVVT